jgi:ankyrin repeat protein
MDPLDMSNISPEMMNKLYQIDIKEKFHKAIYGCMVEEFKVFLMYQKELYNSKIENELFNLHRININYNNNVFLKEAAFVGNYEIFKLLLEIDDISSTIDHNEIIRIAIGAKPRDESRDIPKEVAYDDLERFEIVNLLINHESITSDTVHGCLLGAISRRRPKIVKLLLQHEKFDEQYMKICFYEAAETECKTIIRLIILDDRLNVNYSNSVYLSHSVKIGNVDCVKYLLERNVEITDANIKQVMMRQASDIKFEILNLLLEQYHHNLPVEYVLEYGVKCFKTMKMITPHLEDAHIHAIINKYVSPNASTDLEFVIGDMGIEIIEYLSTIEKFKNIIGMYDNRILMSSLAYNKNKYVYSKLQKNKPFSSSLFDSQIFIPEKMMESVALFYSINRDLIVFNSSGYCLTCFYEQLITDYSYPYRSVLSTVKFVLLKQIDNKTLVCTFNTSLNKLWILMNNKYKILLELSNKYSIPKELIEIILHNYYDLLHQEEKRKNLILKIRPKYIE